MLQRKLRAPKKIRVADLEYEVRTVRGKRAPKGMGKSAEGLTDLYKGAIYIREWVVKNRSRYVATLTHEIVHAALDASGAGRLLCQLADAQKRDPEDLEEDFVRMLTPAIVTALQSAGLLKG